MDLLTMFLKGGVIMYAILLSSIIGVAVAIDKFILLHKSKVNVAAFMIKLRTLLKKHDVAGAIAFCNSEKTPAANIIKKGLKKIRFGHQRVKEALEDAGRQEISKLEKGLSTLATVAGIAPMLGFLGTVTGMVTAFQTIQDLMGAANPSDLAGGIWEALITTVFGLIVGIPAFAFYNFFTEKIKKLIADIEVISTDLIDIVEEASRIKKGNEDDDEISL
ncbi:MAG: MotA/TolQ/ExbB proton channel family protein [Ignavibacteria bacterium CG_4_8_14_3_um_filter_37_9]|nr:MotA/TolQ/ExbB proton channel family protein [Ignavibacteria bacterium]OIO21506.1 MAG: biopolymer transporter [Ignavibacteria bacterium CG1_02_37_35]PIP77988.1 MAG: biopolymer transporter [Ignavibacteria bacterium CG22_combo_CG10-13_8_21_14_all_37_15]PIS45096.1 MAG: MotA/TolQ/ExbB proton channel family protein [Ignavibacteria bacterium CG08_land_8_20_14_0_20_37_9]PIX00392.1 MAG: MotA/TolQ/ExbB proton channel family protein [Ignavibacteria bacterium CG_4_8_14_3_um_filter_37_9]PIX93193.1 MAG: